MYILKNKIVIVLELNSPIQFKIRFGKTRNIDKRNILLNQEKKIIIQNKIYRSFDNAI